MVGEDECAPMYRHGEGRAHALGCARRVDAAGVSATGATAVVGASRDSAGAAAWRPIGRVTEQAAEGDARAAARASLRKSLGVFVEDGKAAPLPVW